MLRAWLRPERLWTALTAVVVLGAIGTMLFNRYQYGNYNPWSAPLRFDYCGARFSTGDDVGVIVTKAQALSDAGTALVRRGSLGLFGQWPVFVREGFQCPQDPNVQNSALVFLVLGPDRYLELSDVT